MKRFTDEEYGKYSVHMAMQKGIDVKCPNCNKRGIVTRQEWGYQFVCTCCNKNMKTEQFHYEYDVQNQCEAWGRYYRVDITSKFKKDMNPYSV